MSRRTKLTPEIQEKICEMLSKGLTVENVCALVGIAERTYYYWVTQGENLEKYIHALQQNRPDFDLDQWVTRGKAAAERKRKPNKKDLPYCDFYQRWAHEQPHFQFLQAVTRAKAEALKLATYSLMIGMQPSRTVQETVETITETRLDKFGKPYVYSRTVTKQTVINAPPDWRAALEYLKRRDPANWSEKYTIEEKDWRTQVLEDVRNGVLTIEQVIAAFGGKEDLIAALGKSTAARLFESVGVPSVADIEES